ncbi:YeeE/YedE family protein [Roseococcus pinisoli]|uniref:YeeE/YedE family protein n=1 Tax=Roseococcus pinisoli TaxID=2835040 RepID=A0ABS5QBD8_9PROT|nr:YeeE/YedE family protein [Roseococcus pinisoli]MBS7811009.1 YeeE/YedE family protein [Roseococcus pinisoli]
MGWAAAATGVVALAAIWAAVAEDRALVFALVLGAGFGLVLQRSRFCFLCLLRDAVTGGDPRGLLGLLAALAVGTLGYAVVFGAWLPVPLRPGLPPDAHIGPVSWVLVLAGIAFGLGMTLSGSCVSGHLYRLGEGSLRAPVALLGTGIGFVAGLASWPGLYEAGIRDAPVVWLPHHLGYAGSILLTLAVLALLALPLLRRLPAAEAGRTGGLDLGDVLHRVFRARWPAWLGGLAVGAIGTVAYLRTEPLGVTAAIGGWSRQAGAGLGLVPDRLPGLDAFAGCGTAPDAIIGNATFVGAMVAASFVAAGIARQVSFDWPGWRKQGRTLAGGVLLGWGSMTGLGCTVGTLLSGGMAAALSGWVFGLACMATAAVTLRWGWDR